MATPSFASFPERPKPTDPSEATSKPAAVQVLREDARDRRRDGSDRNTKSSSDHRSHSHDRHGHKHRRHESERHTHEHDDRKDGHRPKQRDADESSRKRRRVQTTKPQKHEVAIFPATLTESVSREWYEDISGDPGNLRYGGIPRSKVAEYRLSGAGFILGLPFHLRLQQDTKNHVGDGLRMADYSLGKANRSSRQGLHPATAARQLLPDLEERDVYSSDLSYLALPGKRRSRRDRIAGLPSRLGEIASGSDDSSDDSIPEETAFAIAEPARQGAVELQRHLEADPTDIDGWIRLSKLEGAAPSDSMARQNSNTGVATSRRAQSEIAHTVLSRAIAAAPANQASIRLEMEYMRHAEVIWPSAKVTARWKYLLEQEDRWTDDRAYMDIWLGYIAWMEGRGLDTKQEADSSDTTSNQGVDGVIALYVDCIRVMRKLALKRYPGEAEEENLVYLVLRACLFIRHAGYAERALGIMQAMLQLNFALPSLRQAESPQDDLARKDHEKVRLQELEAAWDEEKPRIGDGDFSSSSAAAQSGASSTGQALAHSKVTDPFSAWYKAEADAMNRDWKSASATSLDAEINDEDPFRVVLFSDISDFLCYLAGRSAREQLVYAALVFLELPHAFPLAGTNTPFSSDPYLTGAIAKASALQGSFWPLRESTDTATEVEAVQFESTQTMACPVKLWSQDIASVLGTDPTWFGVLDAADLHDKNSTFIRNALEALRSFSPDVGIVSASISMDYAIRGIKQAVKSSKALLGADRNNISLWLCYATLVGYAPGRIAEARQVLATCLQAVDRGDSDGVLAICATWAELELFKGDAAISSAICANALSAMTGGRIDAASALFDTPTKALNPTVLRAQTALDHVPLFVSLDLFKLKSILTYLLFDRDPSRAISYLHTALTAIPHTSPESEAAHQHLVRLLRAHTLARPTPPSLLRGVLEDAIRLFPSNTMLLSLYLAGEAHGRVYGRVHTLIHQQLLRGRGGAGGGGDDASEQVTPVTALWAVWAEAQMAGPRFWDAQGGAERVRSVFRAALEMTRVRKSALFWRLHIEFEIHQARPHQAKALCYRAIGELGACKDLYLLPFSPMLRPHFTPKELRAWADLMLERGLRVRVPFERFFAREEESEAESDGEAAEEVGDDPFDKLHERVRLMPY